MKKLDARAHNATMMGYSTHGKGHDTESKKFVVSRDVTFKEEVEDIHIKGEIAAAPKNSATTSQRSIHATTKPPCDVANNDKASLLNENYLDGYEKVPTHDDGLSTSTPHEPLSRTRLRRSSRVARPLTNWWQATPSSSTQAERNTSTFNETSLFAADVPSSSSHATSHDNVLHWAPGAKNVLDSIKSYTLASVESKTNTNLTPCHSDKFVEFSM